MNKVLKIALIFSLLMLSALAQIDDNDDTFDNDDDDYEEINWNELGVGDYIVVSFIGLVALIIFCGIIGMFCMFLKDIYEDGF